MLPLRSPSEVTAISTEATKALLVGRRVLGHVELVELVLAAVVARVIEGEVSRWRRGLLKVHQETVRVEGVHVVLIIAELL